MGNYVKVKKAKVLRFQLISVMYLLFISLSILQIPIDWLRTNVNVANYINRSTKVEMDVPIVLSTYQELEKIEKNFFKLAGYDLENKVYNDPDGYSITDQFFIRDNKAEDLFNDLLKLREHYEALPDDNPKKEEFRNLFQSDLKHGLKEGNVNIWSEWKFKHVPSGVVVTWLADLKLRLKLLNGGIILNEEQNADYLVLMAYNIQAVRPGDTVRIVVFNHEEMDVTATENNQTFELDNWSGDTLLFIPRYVGTYDLSFKKNGVEESLKVTSVAKKFEVEKDNKYNIFYEGKASELHYVNLIDAQTPTCSCDPDIKINKQLSKVEFIPKSPGWCYFDISNNQGKNLLKDSIYVQKLPTPFVYAKEVSGGSLSRARLKAQGIVSLAAAHPDLQKFEYKLSNVSYRLVGASTDIFSAEGNVISVPTEFRDNVKYIAVESADINTNIKGFKFETPLIIEVK